MSENIKLVAYRIKELREIMDYSVEEVAKMLSMSVEQYNEYESGNTDIPISVLYEISNQLGVELTTILTGEEPRLKKYSFVKNGQGIDIERSKQYKYKNLAYKMQNKKSEVLLVTVDPAENGDTEIHLNTHPGQELDYVLEGNLVIKVGDAELVMGVGDTLYYDSTCPHGMKCIGDKPAKILTVITA